MNAIEVLSQQLLEPFQRLPEDIILEIFLKLPLTSLLTLRCVSKSWSIQFNENPKFIDMIKNSFSLMLIDDKTVCSLDNNSLSSSLFDGIEGHFEKIHCPLVPLGWNIENANFVGSCNGLFCMYRSKDCFCLWNPCTNEIKFVSKLGFQWAKAFGIADKGHGFGYDSKNDDYKYVCILGLTRSEVHIYSFRTNTWKQICIPYKPVNVENRRWAPDGVFCDGALHWFARGFSYYPKVLLAFDMTEECVREVPQPENLDTKKFGTIKYVDVLDECLCILYSNSAGFEIWVMKDYGKKESWTKLYSITELTLLETKSFVYLTRILCLRTGEILLEVQYDFFKTTALVLYDPKNEKHAVLKIHKNLEDSRLPSLFCRYVKSSVKLNLVSYDPNNFTLMLISDNDIYSLDNESLSSSSSLLDGVDSHIKKVHCLVAPQLINFLGCSNGWFCISTNNILSDLSLWNPCTRDYKRISPPQFEVHDSFHCRLEVLGYGFGYDSKSDDYKVVCIASDSMFNQDVTQIYSLRSKSWRKIQHIHSLQPYGSYGVFCNGALHWQSSSSSKALIALCMTDEHIREISQPDNLDFKKLGVSTYIDALDGCLCMLYCSINLGFQVWLMKDYGNKESWTKMYNISKFVLLNARNNLGLRRIKCLKTGEILLEVHYHSMSGANKEGLVLYDPKTEISKEVKLNRYAWRSSSPSWFHTYVKSSISLSSN